MVNEKVVVVGDTILDINTYGEMIGFAAETPTPVMKIEKSRTTYGGAAYVVRNLLQFGPKVVFLTDCIEASCSWQDNTHGRLQLDLITTRPPPVKHRFWCDDYKVFQVDQVNNEPLNEDEEDALIDEFRELVTPECVVIFSDYRHGFLTEECVYEMISHANYVNARTIVDSQVSKRPPNLYWYDGVTAVCLNEKEADLQRHVVRDLDKELVIVKRGMCGATLYFQDRDLIHIPGYPVKAVDTCGAGDAFLACWAAYWGHAEIETVTRLANKWASMACLLQGTEVPDYDQFRKEIL